MRSKPIYSCLKQTGIKRVLFLLGLFLLPVGIGTVRATEDNAGTFTNPVFKGADPWVYKTDSCYFYCFVNKNGIAVSKTMELNKKGNLAEVWKAPAEGWNKSCIWAPELHYIHGKWYIYYAAGESGPPYIHQRTGVLESVSSDPQGAYIDKGMIYTGDNVDRYPEPCANRWAIDMTVFEWRKKLYAVWSGWENNETTDKTCQNLYLAEMKNPWTISMNRVLISEPDQPWETGGKLDLNEGPQVLINGDQLFIIYSCGQSWLSTYKLAQLELKNLHETLLDRDNWIKTGPVFTGNEEVYGVGHACFTTSPDGAEHWIVYHTKTERKPGWKRQVCLQRFTFNPDGSPHFGKAQPVTVPQPLPSIGTNCINN